MSVYILMRSVRSTALYLVFIRMSMNSLDSFDPSALSKRKADTENWQDYKLASSAFATAFLWAKSL